MNVRRLRSGRWQLRVVHRILPKDFYATFDSEDEAREYGRRLESLLDRGILIEGIVQPRVDDPSLRVVIQSHQAAPGVSAARVAVLDVLLDELGALRLSAITYRWAEAWVAAMKLEANLAPGTIRKRVSALAHAIDAYHRGLEQAPTNPLRLLPRGYSTYSESDAATLAKKGLEARHDVERDRRLEPDEEKRVRAALAGEKRPDRERALDRGPEFAMLFELILETGMRLREAYTLRVEDIDLARSTINVAGTKGRGGRIKPRQVPIKPVLHARLSAYCKDRVGLLFSYWDGNRDRRAMARVTSTLSRAFGTLFDYAKVPGFTEHDLRHEACCRWVVLRNSRGGWMFSEVEVAKIMGWNDLRMLMRYASLRGTDLAARFND